MKNIVGKEQQGVFTLSTDHERSFVDIRCENMGEMGTTKNYFDMVKFVQNSIAQSHRTVDIIAVTAKANQAILAIGNSLLKITPGWPGPLKIEDLYQEALFFKKGSQIYYSQRRTV